MSEAQYNGSYNAIAFANAQQGGLFCKEGEASATYELMSEAQYNGSYNPQRPANARKRICNSASATNELMSEAQYNAALGRNEEYVKQYAACCEFAALRNTNLSSLD